MHFRGITEHEYLRAERANRMDALNAEVVHRIRAGRIDDAASLAQGELAAERAFWQQHYHEEV